MMLVMLRAEQKKTPRKTSEEVRERLLYNTTRLERDDDTADKGQANH